MAHSSLISQLTRRAIFERYRGSVLGILWSFLTPLMMLIIYTFVFGTIFKARWQVADRSADTGEFAVILFAGLIIHGLFADVVLQAPSLITGNVNFVKKVIFPLRVLTVVSVASALFQMLISLLVLLIFATFVIGVPPITLLWLPVILLPFLLLLLGFSWFLSALGVYLRDISQILSPIVVASLFLSPTFFPLSAMPAAFRPYLYLNPITLIVEQARGVIIFGSTPDFMSLAVYTAVAIVVCGMGYFWFHKTRKGFADVL